MSAGLIIYLIFYIGLPIFGFSCLMIAIANYHRKKNKKEKQKSSSNNNAEKRNPQKPEYPDISTKSDKKALEEHKPVPIDTISKQGADYSYGIDNDLDGEDADFKEV